MKTFKEYINESEKNSARIGKIALNICKKDDKEFVIIKPDVNQSDDHREIARNWINNHFLDKSKFKSGTTSFTLENWKKPGGVGEKFVSAIKKSNNIISWVDLSEKKSIMKGVKGLSDNQAFGGMGGSSLGGGMFRGSPGGMGGGGMPPPPPQGSGSGDLSSMIANISRPAIGQEGAPSAQSSSGQMSQPSSEPPVK